MIGRFAKLVFSSFCIVIFEVMQHKEEMHHKKKIQVFAVAAKIKALGLDFCKNIFSIKSVLCCKTGGEFVDRPYFSRETGWAKNTCNLTWRR